MGYNAFSGLKKGFIRILTDLVAVGAGISLGLKFYSPLAASLKQGLPLSDIWLSILAFGIIWAGVFLAATGIGALLHKIFSLSLLGPLNVMGGLLFGMGRGVLLLLPVLIPMMLFNVAALQESALAPPLKPLVSMVVKKYIPENFKLGSNKKVAEPLPENLIPKDILPEGSTEKIMELMNSNNLNGEESLNKIRAVLEKAK